MNSPQQPQHETLAAIDMGSNSFRLEIAQPHPGRYKRIDYIKETVRLGAGLDEQSMLTDDAMQRGLDCLRRFSKRLDGFKAAQVRAVATQTLREAKNRDVFLALAQPVLGYPVEVISGREEARLIYAGVARLQPSEERRLVIDIGGRSTEMILGQGRTPLQAESFRVGSVSLSMRYFPEGRYTETAFREAQIAAGAELEEALEPFAPIHWREALGSSGTAGAVSQLLEANGITDGSITSDALRWCMSQCLKAGRVDKLELAGLKDDRRAVIAGGLAILYTLTTQFGIKVLKPARGALRQGVIFDLDARLNTTSTARTHDARESSVRELQRRFEVDVAQAKRVAEVACALYQSLSPQIETTRELAWACALHEMGMMVSHHDHHRHSAYLLGHVDAAGFSQSQLRRLADLVLAQRGGLRKVEQALQDKDVFALQAMCLRLGVIACHARHGVNRTALQLERQGKQVMLALSPDWAHANPRTMYLLAEEASAWERVGSLKLQVKA